MTPHIANQPDDPEADSGTGDTTLDGSESVPARELRALRREREPHLALCWSADEPDRIGETAPITARCLLGRGTRRDAQEPARAKFFRQRPQGRVEQPPLSSPSLSRQQLVLVPRPGGGVEVENVGRLPLLVNARPVSQATLAPGDTLSIGNALVLMLVTRPTEMEPLNSFRGPMFGFGEPDPSGMVGETQAAWDLRERLAFAASLDQHVLLLGPSGSGKELAARAVHDSSARANKRFVARNAATLPETLVDAELFGNAKDYPSAGMPRRSGLIAEADGGCLFLDEVGELPSGLQAHLLRVMDREGEFQRLGEALISRANVRFLAATNRPLSSLKHDFAARFKLRVEVPGLERRREDVPLIARHILRGIFARDPRLADRFCDRSAAGTWVPRLHPMLVDALLRHDWSAHTRELERVLLTSIAASRQRALALTPEVVRQLSARCADATSESSLSPEQIRQAVEMSGGNITRAAISLGLKNRFTLYRLMKKLGIATR